MSLDAALMASQLRRALALEPDKVEALYWLSNLLYGHQNVSELSLEAEALLDRAITLAPDNVDLLAADRETIARNATS